MINNNMIEILGKVFVNNNKDNCFLLINDNFIELSRYINLEEVFDDFDISKFEEIEINIIERNNKKISDLSFMFYEISSSSISLDFSNFNMTNIIKLNYMFYKCSLMTDLPNILGWNSINVIDMSYMFANCSSLKSLPGDMSEWAMENVIDISYMFSNCGSLKKLPDLSKWKTSKIVNMQYLFYNCSSLSFLPDISKWNTEKVTDISYMISGCTSLLKVPGVLNWDISNLNDARFLFYNCKTLLNIPNASNWVKFRNNNIRIDNMFNGCKNILLSKDGFPIDNNLNSYNNCKDKLKDYCSSCFKTNVEKFKYYFSKTCCYFNIIAFLLFLLFFYFYFKIFKYSLSIENTEFIYKEDINNLTDLEQLNNFLNLPNITQLNNYTNYTDDFAFFINNNTIEYYFSIFFEKNERNELITLNIVLGFIYIINAILIFLKKKCRFLTSCIFFSLYIFFNIISTLIDFYNLTVFSSITEYIDKFFNYYEELFDTEINEEKRYEFLNFYGKEYLNFYKYILNLFGVVISCVFFHPKNCSDSCDRLRLSEYCENPCHIYNRLIFLRE